MLPWWYLSSKWVTVGTRQARNFQILGEGHLPLSGVNARRRPLSSEDFLMLNTGPPLSHIHVCFLIATPINSDRSRRVQQWVFQHMLFFTGVLQGPFWSPLSYVTPSTLGLRYLFWLFWPTRGSLFMVTNSKSICASETNLTTTTAR